MDSTIIENGNIVVLKWLKPACEIKPGINGRWVHISGSTMAWPLNDFRYHEDWNLLMPVVVKLSNTHYNPGPFDHSYDNCAYPRTFGMRDSEGDYLVRFNACPLFTHKEFITAVWLAVVDLIKSLEKPAG